MSLSRPELQKMLDVVRATQPIEIDCDVCLMQVVEFAELNLVGKPIPEGLKAIEQHLSICDECREEYEMLCVALRK
jgi:predicted anti-sigma-YlaC factor YlaD